MQKNLKVFHSMVLLRFVENLLPFMKKKENIKQILIEAPFVVKNAELFSSCNLSFILITTADNRLWKVSLHGTEVCKSSRKNEDDASKLEEEPMDSEDIFGELLGHNSGAKTACQKLLPFSSDSVATVIIIKADNLLFESNMPVLDVALWDKLIAVILEDSSEAKLCVLMTGETVISTRKRSQATILQIFHLGLKASFFKNKQSKSKKHLYFVLQQETSTGSQNQQFSSSSVHLPKSLFVSLFGKEASLLNSPVVLVCSNSGCVLSYVVQHIKPAGPYPRLPVICQMNSEIVNVSQVFISWPEEIADKNQDVILALSSALQAKNHDNSGKADVGLLLVSVIGECCLIIDQNKESLLQSIFSFSLPSSVESCTVHGKLLVYSTGKALETCQINLCKSPCIDHWSVLPEFRTLLCKAEILHLIPFPSCASSTEDDFIVAVMAGCVVTEISITERQKAVTDTDSHSFAEILHNIDKCTGQIKDIKTKSSSLDCFLLQMNILAIMKQRSQEQSRAEQTQAPLQEDSVITCSCGITYGVNGYRPDWNLKVQLRNNSSVSLSNDWTLVITVTEQGCTRNQHRRISKTHSLRLSKGLSAKSKLEFNVPVNIVVQENCYPQLQVTLSLVLTFKNWTFLSNFSEDQRQKAASAFVAFHTFDVLNFLQPFNGDHAIQSTTETVPLSRLSLTQRICHLAEMKVKGCLASGSNELENFTIKLGVSNAVAENFDTTSDVLNVIWARDDKEASPHSSCQLQTPSGTLVTISVVTAKQDPDLITLSHYLKFVITLRSSDAVLLNEMKVGIKERLQASRSNLEKLSSLSKVQLQDLLDSAEQVKEFLCLCQGQVNSSHKNHAKLACDMLNKFELIDCFV
ncbi:hypothetical protein Btru_077525 [Bulinus truncatus]|nr:hypothetical protein Btru_077525 [Bulinus truncatus]